MAFSTLLTRLRIADRITLGFGIVLALLVAVAALGFFGIGRGETAFGEQSRLAAGTQTLADLERDAIDLRRRLYAFVARGEAQDLAEIRGLEQAIRATIARDEKDRQSEGLAAAFDALVAAIDEVAKLRQLRDQVLNGELLPAGDLASEQMAKLLVAGIESLNWDFASLAGYSQQELLQSKALLGRFLEAPAPELQQRINRQLDSFENSARPLRAMAAVDPAWPPPAGSGHRRDPALPHRFRRGC